jgi:hypothetical protein
VTEYTAAAAPARPSWREENRQDRILRARLDREREEARARVKRDAAADRRASRAATRAERDARRAARAAWIAGHVTDLLFVPVIGVPAALAWSAMAAFGYSLYGGPGWTLPAFSEGAMWAFEAKATINRRRTAADGTERPVWHLQLGAAVFAGFGFVLNFLHGLSPSVPYHGPVTGTVMGLISIAGLITHQITEAGPRRPARSREERDAARLDRARRRRELAARKAAVRKARAVLDADGNVRLVYQPAPEPAPPVPEVQPDPVPLADPVPAPGVQPRRARSRTPGAPRRRTRNTVRTRTPVTAESAAERFAADLDAGRVPSIRQIKQELHVGQDNARVIRGHLETAAAGTAADDRSDASETA